MPYQPTSCATLALILCIAAGQPAFASLPDCTCKNLASLQQDYRNAKTLEEYFRMLADHLKAFEIDKSEQVTDQFHLRQLSLGEDQDYRSAFPPGNVMEPFEGYSGPSHVEMEGPGKCTQKQDDLDKMEAGSPCRGIADAALNHEAYHSSECGRMGADTYWSLMPSEYALEEAEAYRNQAKALKVELRRVLEAADVTYKATWDLDMSVQGMANYGYRYTAQSKDIGGATDGDTWTTTGEGTSTVVWTKATIAGMNCTPSGAVNTTFETKMETDGLTFSLEVEELSSTGALSISCPGGGGGGGPVGESGAGGQIAENLPLNEGDNVLPGDMASEIRAIMAGMGTVSGDGDRLLSVSCSTP